jgi:hypothetical protein
LRTEGTDHLSAAAEATGVSNFVAQSYAGWNGIREGGRRHVLERCDVSLINAEHLTVPRAFDALDGGAVAPQVLADIHRHAAEVYAAARRTSGAESR